ncbi:hypothetical protein AA106556_0756 [Neokomagataea tanensis NBRC 106556]|uniref:Uncharacterized protein n=1 Tax=Neokomagataea tanensis NBRC 106556 TaxID=1223519 RepID=A0ABQ0QHV4_9PROT|nr:hypothetical protein AA106556_0756 [Neokomagataea tanensis NBRC 106556]
MLGANAAACHEGWGGYATIDANNGDIAVLPHIGVLLAGPMLPLISPDGGWLCDHGVMIAGDDECWCRKIFEPFGGMCKFCGGTKICQITTDQNGVYGVVRNVLHDCVTEWGLMYVLAVFVPREKAKGAFIERYVPWHGWRWEVGV